MRARPPFSRVKRANLLFGRISYVHPTKGLRYRRLTPPLALALLPQLSKGLPSGA